MNKVPYGHDNKKYIFAAVGVILVSAWISGALNLVFHALGNGLEPSANPVAVIKSFAIIGFPLKLFILLCIVFGAVVAYAFYSTYVKNFGKDKLGRGFRHGRDMQPYGDSHFEEPEEYEDAAQIRKIEKARGIILGQLTQDGSQVIDFLPKGGRINSHMFVVGASGSGKTYTFAKNYCFQNVKQKSSIIMTDPDGGLYRDMSEYFKDNGYIVRHLDFSNPIKSDGWDCIKTLRGDKLEINSSIFASVVTTNISGGSGNDIYSTAGTALLNALLLRVLLGHDYAPEEKNINEVYKLLQNPGGVEYLDTLFDPTLLTEEEEPCLGPYLSFKMASKNLSGNIATHLSVGLRLLQTKLIADILSTDDIDLLLPGKQPCAYFCQFPDSQDNFKFLISLFFSMLFITLIDYADNETKDGKLPVQVNFLLDEFPSIGILPDWSRKMSTIRKRNINVAMIVQDITQLQQNYKETWPSILSNCATLLSLGINDLDSAKWFQQRIGDTSIEVETKKENNMAYQVMKAFDSRSVGFGKRSLLTVSELFEVPGDRCLIVFQRHNPIMAYTVPHTLHPESSKLKPIFKNDVVNFTDRVRREQLRDEEKKRLEEYWATHSMEPPTYSEEDDEEAETATPVRNFASKLKTRFTRTPDIELTDGAAEVRDTENDLNTNYIMVEPDTHPSNEVVATDPIDIIGGDAVEPEAMTVELPTDDTPTAAAENVAEQQEMEAQQPEEKVQETPSNNESEHAPQQADAPQKPPANNNTQKAELDEAQADMSKKMKEDIAADKIASQTNKPNPTRQSHFQRLGEEKNNMHCQSNKAGKKQVRNEKPRVAIPNTKRHE